MAANPCPDEPVRPCMPLFDPAAGNLPPHEAVELYHEPPPIVSILHNVCTDGGDPGGWQQALEAAWTASREAAIKAVREHVYVKVGFHQPRRGMSSVYWRAHIRVSCVSHLHHPETGRFAQMHDHIYIGATAYPDNTPTPPTLPLPADQTNQAWPIDTYSLRHGTAAMIDAMSMIAGENELTARVGATWTRIPGVRPSDAPRVRRGLDHESDAFWGRVSGTAISR